MLGGGVLEMEEISESQEGRNNKTSKQTGFDHRVVGIRETREDRRVTRFIGIQSVGGSPPYCSFLVGRRLG
jgi:hypothetical protein